MAIEGLQGGLFSAPDHFQITFRSDMNAFASSFSFSVKVSLFFSLSLLFFLGPSIKITLILCP